MNKDQQRGHVRKLLLIGLLGIATPAFPQDGAKQTVEKWRPKEGIYAVPNKNFESWCGEFGDLFVELAAKRIGGHEWSCDITRLTDTEPGAFKLNLICDDLNLANSLKMPEEAQFKEIMLLKKTDDNKISFRKTMNGKFRGSPWRVSYCPHENQQTFKESRARDKAEAARKAEQGHPSKHDQSR